MPCFRKAGNIINMSKKEKKHTKDTQMQKKRRFGRSDKTDPLSGRQCISMDPVLSYSSPLKAKHKDFCWRFFPICKVYLSSSKFYLSKSKMFLSNLIMLVSSNVFGPTHPVVSRSPTLKANHKEYFPRVYCTEYLGLAYAATS